MFSFVSLKVKLAFTFLAVASLVVLVGLINFSALLSIRNAFEEIVEGDVPHLLLLGDVRTAAAELAVETKVLADPDITDPELLTYKAVLDSQLSMLEEKTRLFDEVIKSSEKTSQLSVAAEIDALSGAATSLTKELLTLLEQDANQTVISAKLQATQEAQARFVEKIAEATDTELQVIAADYDFANADTNNAITRLVIAAVGAAILAILVGLLFAFALGRNIKKLQDAAVHVASGDFNYKIDVRSRDEVGRLSVAFNGMATRLKDSYQRIALEKQRDDALLESMGEGLLAVDQDAKVVLANSVAVRLLELPSRQEVIGTTVYDVLHIFNTRKAELVSPEQHPSFITLHSGNAMSDVFGYKKKSGAKILLGVSANPVILNGKTVGAIIIMRDVTKEKEVDRMKTEFISLASHQLRTPLSAIRWFTEMLLSGDAGKITAEQQEFTKNIYDSTQRMIDLVNSLLNISRIESGRIIIDPQPTDLGELIHGIVTDLKGKTAEKQQSLVVSVHKDLPKINIDPRLIGQVYLNFLTNAIKYTPKGGEIAVFVSRKDDQVVSQITDNGYGIPKEQQGRVFQKFFRAENVVKTVTDGTGLGLYLVKAIIESSGGKVWFKSEEGKGTSFWFSIPMSGMKAQEGEVTLDA